MPVGPAVLPGLVPSGFGEPWLKCCLFHAAEKARKPSLAIQGLVAVLEIKTQRATPAGQAEKLYVTTPDTTYLTDVIRSAAADALVFVPRGEGELDDGALVDYLRLD